MIINVICYTKYDEFLTKIINKIKMKKNQNDYKYCIDVALNKKKKRIELLDKSDKKSVLEEYREWFKEGLNYHSVLLLREDPII